MVDLSAVRRVDLMVVSMVETSVSHRADWTVVQLAVPWVSKRAVESVRPRAESSAGVWDEQMGLPLAETSAG